MVKKQTHLCPSSPFLPPTRKAQSDDNKNGRNDRLIRLLNLQSFVLSLVPVTNRVFLKFFVAKLCGLLVLVLVHVLGLQNETNAATVSQYDTVYAPNRAPQE